MSHVKSIKTTLSFMIKFIGKNCLRFIGIGILIFFYVRWDFFDILKSVRNTDIVFFTGAIVCVNMVVLLQACRGYILLDKECSKLEFLTYVRFYFVTMAASMVSPGRVGAVTQVPLLHQRGIGVDTAFANVLYDKLCDLIGFLAMGAFFGILITENRIVNPLFLIFLCGIILIIMWYLDRFFIIASKLLDRFFPRLSGKLNGKRIKIKNEIKIYALILTVFRLFGAVAIHWFVARSAGMTFPLTLLAAAAAFGALSTLLPVSVMGIGLREGIFLLLFSGRGYTEEQILTFAFLMLLAYLSTIPIGIFIALSSGKVNPDNLTASKMVRLKNEE